MSHTIKNKKDLVLLGEPVFIDTAVDPSATSDPDCECNERFTGFFSDQSANRMELNIYDESGEVLITSTIGKYEVILPDPQLLNDTYRLKIDIDEDLRDNEITQGAFHVVYNYLRPITNLIIEEISPSRKEIRVKPLGTAWDVTGYKSLLSYSPVAADQTRNELVLNLGEARYKTIVNWTTDAQASGQPSPPCEDIDTFAIDFDDPDDPWSSAVLKLYQPLADDIVARTTFELDLCIVDPFVRDVILYPTAMPPVGRHLRAPDWDIRVKKKIQQSTGYENRDSLVGSVSSVKTQLINQILSGSQEVDLNYDFRYFDDFIHFSTAEERLNNFFYKAKEIEQYNQNIADLSTNLPIVSASLSGSYAYQNNIVKYTTQRDALLGTFDEYENYLYYESASAGSSSFNKTGWYPTTWPKQNSSKPYELYSYTSSVVTDWYGTVGSKTGIIYSASLYDRGNPDELAKTIPNHIREDQYNDFYDSFVKMCGQFFDKMYFYTKHLSTLVDRHESIHEGMPKELIFNVLQGFGWDPSNGMQFEDLWKSSLGTDISGSYQTTSSLSVSESMQYVVSESTPRKEINQEVWKRILNNLPYLLKTKGSFESVRALINCYGIPSTMLDIKEFGGPNAIDQESYFQHDKFDYAMNFYPPSGSNLLLNSPVGQLRLEQTGRSADALELRFRTVDASANGATLTPSQSMQILIEDDLLHRAALRIRQSGSTDEWGVLEQVNLNLTAGEHVTQSIGPAPIFNGEWWTVLYQRLNPTVYATADQEYVMYLKQEGFGKITQEFSGSWVISGSLGPSIEASQSFNLLRTRRRERFGNGDESFGFPFEGSMQEIRLWATALSESAFNSHVLSPLTYVGNSPNAAFDDLAMRLTLGTDLHPRDLTEYHVVSSSHPNQGIDHWTNGSEPLVATASGFLSGSDNSFTANEERVYQVWPDSGGNRSVSNKIRIEKNRLTGNLDLKNRLEISSYDNFPNDSSKVGVYFSPTNEINEDIAEQMGGFDIDDYIGNPALQYSQSYEELRILRDEYFKKYQYQGYTTDFDSIVHDNKYSYIDYFRLVKFFDTSLFKQIEYLLPARANPLLGVVVEPHVLERSKQTILKGNPTHEDEQIPMVHLNPTESLSSSYHYLTASIVDIDPISGSYHYITGSFERPVEPSGSYHYITSSIDVVEDISASFQETYTEVGSTLWTIGSMQGIITPYDFSRGSVLQGCSFREVKYQAELVDPGISESYYQFQDDTPTTHENVDGGTENEYSWQNLALLDPGLCASITSAYGDVYGFNSKYLFYGGFDLGTVPDNAENISIKVTLQKSQSGTDIRPYGHNLDITDENVRLRSGDTGFMGNNMADTSTRWPGYDPNFEICDCNVIYNSAHDPNFWGITLTPAIVNDPEFGIAIQADFGSPVVESPTDTTGSIGGAPVMQITYTCSVSTSTLLPACNEPELYPCVQRPWVPPYNQPPLKYAYRVIQSGSYSGPQSHIDQQGFWNDLDYAIGYLDNEGANNSEPGYIVINYDSNYLFGANYGYNIPNNTIIKGIQVEIRRKVISGSGFWDPISASVQDKVVCLSKDIESLSQHNVGENKALDGYSVDKFDNYVGNYGRGFSSQIYGSSNDLWGQTWTPAEINNSKFGVQFQLKGTASADLGIKPHVDFLEMTVYYEPQTPPSQGNIYYAGQAEQSESSAVDRTEWDTLQNITGSCNEMWADTGNPWPPYPPPSTVSVIDTDHIFTSAHNINIPHSATIDGIEVLVTKHEDFSPPPPGATREVTDLQCYLCKDLNEPSEHQTGDNKYNPSAEWPSNSTTETYGSSTDLWGQTWTPAEINSPTFGVQFQARLTDDIANPDIVAYVDCIGIKIYYSGDISGNCSTTPSEVSHPNLYGVAHKGHSPMPWYYLPDYYFGGLQTVINNSTLSSEWEVLEGFMTESVGPSRSMEEISLSASLGLWDSHSYAPAEYQDFLPLGAAKARWLGSQCTSPDFNRAATNASEGTVNINGTQDTPDGKAVVELWFTDPNRLFFAPEAQYGNLAVDQSGFSMLPQKPGSQETFVPVALEALQQAGLEHLYTNTVFNIHKVDIAQQGNQQKGPQGQGPIAQQKGPGNTPG